MRRSFNAMLLLVLGLTASSSAQITISTNTFQPAVGTVLQTRGDAAIDANFYNSLTSGSGGPMVWDFSSRTYSAPSVQTVVNPATAPAKDSFPTANLVIRIPISTTDTAWAFQRSVSSTYSELGTVSHGTAGERVTVFQDVAPDAVFPMTEGSTWKAHRTWTQPAGLYMTHSYDTTTYTVDAYGTAKYGTKLVACLRIAMHEQITNRTYKGDTLISTFLTDIFGANFVAAGYSSLVSVSKSVSGANNYYGSYASADFLSSPTDVNDDGSGSRPESFSIDQNYPNPFNPDTEIRFSLPTRSQVELTVYNLSGQEVTKLVDGSMAAGSYVATWDGTDRSHTRVASGIYFYRLDAGSFSQTRKMVLLK